MQHLYAIKVQWQHEGQFVAGCILVQASDADDALQRANGLLATRISEGKNVELSTKVEKVPDNCFIVCGKKPALPKIISAVGASF
jgi:hypothetical protein